ncbi:hypothetical protein MLD38_023546 [Melastoma candidum]|uniref:Uncharacterized protein n=2 Tax=Melastoma candidum TaxID=119954 RepID=A0ACB9NW49_9MYRT|nr:hypothetical protein MLD38_023546 [Melastoma candidum]
MVIRRLRNSTTSWRFDPNGGRAKLVSSFVSRWKLSILLASFFLLWSLFLFSRCNPTTMTPQLPHRASPRLLVKPKSSLSSPSSSVGTIKKPIVAPRKCHVTSSNVYVYDLPPKFNYDILKDCHHLNMFSDICPHVVNFGLGQPMSVDPLNASTSSWFTTYQFMNEVIFHARLLDHPCLTTDPAHADLFYVPFYGGFHASSNFHEPNHNARDLLAVELMEYLQGQPMWAENDGKDHFLVLGRTAWDFMRNTNQGPDFGANSLLNMPAVQNMSVLLVERQPWTGTNQYGIPYPSYFHPSMPGEMWMWLKHVSEQERPYLFSFVGGPRNGVGGKGTVRNEIIRQCKDSDRCEFFVCNGTTNWCHDPNDVMKVMMNSQFCLQTPGDSFTRRSTFDSILAGCIPVFFSPHTAYTQYQWFLPEEPSDYSVYLEADDTVNATKILGIDIEKELMKVPREKIAAMRQRVIDLIPTISYANPNSTNYGFRDVVDVTIGALSLQIKSLVLSSSS